MNSDEKLVVRTRKSKSFGSIIQEYRQRNGWTQEELAWRVGVTRAQIGRIERDQCVPTVGTVEKLERALQLPRLTLLEVMYLLQYLLLHKFCHHFHLLH